MTSEHQYGLPRWFRLFKLAPVLLDLIDEIIKEVKQGTTTQEEVDIKLPKSPGAKIPAPLNEEEPFVPVRPLPDVKGYKVVKPEDIRKEVPGQHYY